MCYKKPGPRCSYHAREALKKASAAVNAALAAGDQDAYITARFAADDAQAAYDRTPAGIAAIKETGKPEDLERARQYAREREEALRAMTRVAVMAADRRGARYDDDGYDADGYDWRGIDREGFDREGYHCETRLDREGYTRDGYTREGYDRYGYDGSGYDRSGYNRDGYDRQGRDREGFSRCDSSADREAIRAHDALPTVAAVFYHDHSRHVVEYTEARGLTEENGWKVARTAPVDGDGTQVTLAHLEHGETVFYTRVLDEGYGRECYESVEDMRYERETIAAHNSRQG